MFTVTLRQASRTLVRSPLTHTFARANITATPYRARLASPLLDDFNVESEAEIMEAIVDDHTNNRKFSKRKHYHVKGGERNYKMKQRKEFLRLKAKVRNVLDRVEIEQEEIKERRASHYKDFWTHKKGGR